MRSTRFFYYTIRKGIKDALMSTLVLTGLVLFDVLSISLLIGQMRSGSLQNNIEFLTGSSFFTIMSICAVLSYYREFFLISQEYLFSRKTFFIGICLGLLVFLLVFFICARTVSITLSFFHISLFYEEATAGSTILETCIFYFFQLLYAFLVGLVVIFIRALFQVLSKPVFLGLAAGVVAISYLSWYHPNSFLGKIFYFTGQWHHLLYNRSTNLLQLIVLFTVTLLILLTLCFVTIHLSSIDEHQRA